MNRVLAYDPGLLPTMPAPQGGEAIELRVSGLPPYKDTSFSIRNPKHKHHERFVALRAAAIEAMAGRAWSHGAIGLDLEVHAPNLEPGRTLVDYLAGVMDTLDGSHGTHFTYLPVAYNDDCQVCDSACIFNRSEDEWYAVQIRFLANSGM
ncbi:MAG: hypothetical protein H5T65_13200 [Chloroflexi bacterium]|nr:hypothetical protein [Chloroflexota bacterium]